MKNLFWRWLGLMLLLLLALSLVGIGCGPKAGPKGRLKVGIMGVASFTPLQVALEEGLFAKEGLEVEFMKMGGGAELLPAVEAGKLDVTATNLITPISGRAEGFPFVFIAFNESTATAPPDGGMLLVKKGVKIKEVKQLEGGTVAVNTLRSVSYLAVAGALQKKGVDLKKVNFLEVPYASVGDSIQNGLVDAGFSIEPFSSKYLGTGKFDVLGYPYVEYMPDIPLGSFVTTEKWVKANGEVAKKFARALNEGTDRLNKADKAKALQYVANFSGTQVEGIQGTILPVWKAKFKKESLQKLADMMLEHGILKQKMDINPMLYETVK